MSNQKIFLAFFFLLLLASCGQENTSSESGTAEAKEEESIESVAISIPNELEAYWTLLLQKNGDEGYYYIQACGGGHGFRFTDQYLNATDLAGRSPLFNYRPVSIENTDNNYYSLQLENKETKSLIRLDLEYLADNEIVPFPILKVSDENNEFKNAFLSGLPEKYKSQSKFLFFVLDQEETFSFFKDNCKSYFIGRCDEFYLTTGEITENFKAWLAEEYSEVIRVEKLSTGFEDLTAINYEILKDSEKVEFTVIWGLEENINHSSEGFLPEISETLLEFPSKFSLLSGKSSIDFTLENGDSTYFLITEDIRIEDNNHRGEVGVYKLEELTACEFGLSSLFKMSVEYQSDVDNYCGFNGFKSFVKFDQNQDIKVLSTTKRYSTSTPTSTPDCKIENVVNRYVWNIETNELLPLSFEYIESDEFFNNGEYLQSYGQIYADDNNPFEEAIKTEAEIIARYHDVNRKDDILEVDKIQYQNEESPRKQYWYQGRTKSGFDVVLNTGFDGSATYSHIILRSRKHDFFKMLRNTSILYEFAAENILFQPYANSNYESIGGGINIWRGSPQYGLREKSNIRFVNKIPTDIKTEIVNNQAMLYLNFIIDETGESRQYGKMRSQ
jgi:hypothetical protein